MRIAIIGAGIVGVTTAYELASDGHEVIVFERGSAVADGASFANAGVISPSQIDPWSAPGFARQAVLQLWSRHAPVRMAKSSLWRHPGWLWRWWRGNPSTSHVERLEQLYRLTRYSQERLDGLALRQRLDYERADGYTVLLRSERDLAAARGRLKMLAELGIGFKLLDAERTRQIEPALNAATPLRAAVHLAGNTVGNCRQFAQLLKAEAQTLGVQFHLRQPVRALRPGSPLSVVLNDGEQVFDAAVVCAGADAGALLAPLGLRLPLLPVCGYSLTAPLRDLDQATDLGPRSAVMDDRYKVVIARLGRRVRVSGCAEIGGQREDFDSRAMVTLHKVLDDWFPGAAQLAKAQRWKGTMSMVPDGLPLIGVSGHPGLWLNLGHGHAGWALSAGSARALADLIARRTPAVQVEGLGVARLS